MKFLSKNDFGKYLCAHVIPAIALLALALLAPAEASAQSMHYLGIAGSNRQTVFATEANGAAAIVGARWKLASSNVVSPSFFGGVSAGQVAAAIREAAGRMNLERDVLFLLLTSHGGPGRGIELSGSGSLSAGQLRGMLDGAGIKNRVIVVSACFAGQFIGPLSGPRSAVLTAADASHSSFGCTNARSYTYFGDALFNYGLKQSRDLRGAFAIARKNISQWERADRLTPSNPQISIGASLAALIARM